MSYLEDTHQFPGTVHPVDMVACLKLEKIAILSLVKNAIFAIFDQVVSGQVVSYPSHKPKTLKI